MEIEKLKVLGYPWHEAHQYELAKLGFKYYMADNTGVTAHKPWRESRRPKPSNVVDLTEADYTGFDLAILHIDECCVKEPPKFIFHTWGGQFRKMMDVCDRYKIPRIIICHGTPMNKANRKEVQDMVGEHKVVCNSHQAEAGWKFKNSTTIIHGIDPDEFYLGKRDKHAVCCAVNPVCMNEQKPVYYGKWIMDRIIDEIDVHFIQAQSFEDYREQLGSYTIYLNTTIDSPMPRARTEAAMMGLCVVSTPYHGWATLPYEFVPTHPTSFVNILKMYLEEGLEEIHKCGDYFRNIAIEDFHISRYLDEWRKLIRSVL